MREQMSKVIPYPSKEELRKRAFEIVVVDRPAAAIADQVLESARAQVRRGLEGIAADAGATVIDRSLQDLSAISKGRHLLLSGIEEEQEEEARAALAAAGLDIQEIRSLEGWLGFVCSAAG